MESYIVRIYQRDADRLVGLVESAGPESISRPFHSADELWQILTSQIMPDPSHPTVREIDIPES